MLYLPRLFVYHSETPKGSIQSETFKIMERRLLKAIINPAMIVTWVLGLILVWQGGWYTSGWLHAKLLLVLILSRRARLPVEDREGIRRRRECAPGEILPHDQRGSDGADDRHRDPGDREAVLIMTMSSRRSGDPIRGDRPVDEIGAPLRRHDRIGSSLRPSGMTT